LIGYILVVLGVLGLVMSALVGFRLIPWWVGLLFAIAACCSFAFMNAPADRDKKGDDKIDN
jgi:4-amino-4-deoxy-L-arabinose transferase-like glycosyltransferase